MSIVDAAMQRLSDRGVECERWSMGGSMRAAGVSLVDGISMWITDDDAGEEEALLAVSFEGPEDKAYASDALTRSMPTGSKVEEEDDTLIVAGSLSDMVALAERIFCHVRRS
jgi:hypothetical protein